MFEHPTESHLKYIDPGVGAVLFPWERRDSEIKESYSNLLYYSGKYPKLTYCEYQKIQSYDTLVHVSSDRLKIYDRDLYIKTRRNKPHKIVFFVHNKGNVAFDTADIDGVSKMTSSRKLRRDINDFYDLTNNNPYSNTLTLHLDTFFFSKLMVINGCTLWCSCGINFSN